MTIVVIVNADDFGLCREITAGIVRAHEEGIVTSTSVAVNGAYFKDGLPLLKGCGIDAGIHLTLTGGEAPVSGTIEGLVDGSGLFLRSYREVAPRIVLGRFDRDALRRELSEQIGMLRDSGVPVSHMDSHQHLHLLPGIRDIAIELAHRFKIRWIRVPSARGAGARGLVMNVLGRGLKVRLREHGLAFTDWFGGFEHRGHMAGARLSSLVKGLGNGITELMVHPGYDASAVYNWGYAWEDELEALTSEDMKAMIKEMGIRLTSFKEIE
ncbi:MAG: ChbG/HpnK family deacetylase [Deltaproteobacteria bacterium]|nr:ChbG/HpnK family deacetylase [Deltaproteobacteria bacterium]MCL5277690.1 ChbG/HpnK family deacetylase [Deltaproteobacteria bacterium]